jgi:3-dehydroquinate synthase
MCLAFDLSVRMGHCDAAEAVRLRAHLKACGLPTSVADIPGAAQLGGWRAERLLEHMRQDKKVRDGRLTFILARGIGETFIANEVDEGEILATLEADIGAA